MADIIIWFTIGFIATFFVYFAFKWASKKDYSSQNESVPYKIDKDVEDKEKDENRPILAPRRGRKASSRSTGGKKKKAVSQRQEKKEEITTYTDDSPDILDIALVAAAVNELMDDDKEDRSFTGLSSIESSESDNEPTFEKASTYEPSVRQTEESSFWDNDDDSSSSDNTGSGSSWDSDSGSSWDSGSDDSSSCDDD